MNFKQRSARHGDGGSREMVLERISNGDCYHSLLRINAEGICSDCNQQVLEYGCDCGICMFCCGMRKMGDYFGFDPRDENWKCLRCGKERKEGRIEICCM